MRSGQQGPTVVVAMVVRSGTRSEERPTVTNSSGDAMVVRSGRVTRRSSEERQRPTVVAMAGCQERSEERWQVREVRGGTAPQRRGSAVEWIYSERRDALINWAALLLEWIYIIRRRGTPQRQHHCCSR